VEQGANQTGRRGVAVSERRLALALADAICVAAAFAVAFNVRTAQVIHAGFSIPKFGVLVFVALWFLCAWLAGVYDVRSMAHVRRSLQAIFRALLLELGGLLLVFFLVPYRVTRPTILIWVPCAAILFIAVRAISRNLLGSVGLSTPTVIVARGKILDQLKEDLFDAFSPYYAVVGTVDPDSPDVVQKLQELVGESNATQIILGVREDVDRSLFRALLGFHERGLAVRSLADIYEELTGRTLLDQLGHSWLMSLPMRSQTSRPYAAFKRCVDIAAGLMALVVLAIVIIPLGLLIKLTSRGPLFHRQRRIGKYGHVFQIIKLRTMRVSDSTQWTELSDSRVTAVGRVLRRLHLDELPQGWNIIRGDMSIVGPRPEQPHYVDELRREIDFYNSRLVVRPGLTGWAQVNRGYSSGISGARTKLSYDLYYIKNQSFTLDLLILVRTVFTIAALKGL
jgi:exopolysaccharide biosynthesis polyprenyl glycosylphosphotransferase